VKQPLVVAGQEKPPLKALPFALKVADHPLVRHLPFGLAQLACLPCRQGRRRVRPCRPSLAIACRPLASGRPWGHIATDIASAGYLKWHIGYP